MGADRHGHRTWSFHMSLEIVRKAAAEQDGVYITLPVSVFAAALKEAGEQPEKGSFAEHVAHRMKGDQDAKMHAHRDAHLGKLLGVKDSAIAAPPAQPLEA